MEIKIPLYNVLNMFLTGFVFIGCTMMQYVDEVIAFIKSDTFSRLTTISETILLLIVIAGAYEVGLILNRLSSILLEPFLIKTKLIPFDNRYSLFQKMSAEYPVLKTLSREYALSRTGMGEFVILSVWSGIKFKWKLVVLFLGISLIYYFSCRKHASKIVKLMKDLPEKGDYSATVK